MTDDIPCLLIGGPGRSGTNVVKEVFKEHPSVLALPFETRFTVDPDGLAPTLRLLRSRVSPFVGEVAFHRLRELLRRVERCTVTDRLFRLLQPVVGVNSAHRRYRDWELRKIFPTFRESSDRLLNDLVSINYNGMWAGAREIGQRHSRFVIRGDSIGEATVAMQNFLRQIYASALVGADRQYYVEDNTYNLLYAPELLDLLPQGKLIHVVRDPRDIVTSYLGQRWTPSTLPDAILYYRTVMENWLRARVEVAPDRYMEVRLEDLCKSPESMFRKISSWLNWPFDDRLLRTDLSRSNEGRWRQELTNSQQRTVNESLAEYIRHFGYVEAVHWDLDEA